MYTFDNLLDMDTERIAIAGHVRPDGDCFGSTTAIWQYLTKFYPHIETTLYLEPPREKFMFLKGLSTAKSEVIDTTPVDLFICCDTSSIERIAVAGVLFHSAKKRICFDHHISNNGFADENYIFPNDSSCAQVIFRFLPLEKIDKDIATSIYTGIVHDSGVFRNSNTGPYTMNIVASLLKKGVDAQMIIDKSVDAHTFQQMRLIGVALERSRTYANGSIIASYIDRDDYARYGCNAEDASCIISELRKVVGTEIAVFAYETDFGISSISFRSRSDIDVSVFAKKFGGGGHIHASGCEIYAQPKNALEIILPEIEKYIRT